MEKEYIDAPVSLYSPIYPSSGKTITDFDKHSKYLVKIVASRNMECKLYEYSASFHEAAHRITEYNIYEDHPSIGKLDTYFFPIAFLYRHCIELGLKAVAFQYIAGKNERIQFIKDTRHNLFELVKYIKTVCSFLPNTKEIEWLEKYFLDISVMDKKSDSFRYPFHIYCDVDELGFCTYGIKRVFETQTSIDLLKFANKFEAAFEIVENWYQKTNKEAVEWKGLNPLFIEEGGYYYAQSVVGYRYNRNDFHPYTKSYLECANFLKWFCKKKAEEGDISCCNLLFLPMGYLYRNCVELNLK